MGQILIIYRCDLGLALLNGSDHVFYRQPLEPMIGFPEKILPVNVDERHSLAIIKWIEDTDDGLAEVWLVMTNFCSLVNLATQTERLIRPELIYETMIAVIYRLLEMDFAGGSFNETVRQGLLAFSYHAFLQWQDTRPLFRRFPSMYKKCLLGSQTNHRVSPVLMLWLLMTGAMSLFNISDEQWLIEELRKYVNICQIRSWKDMRDVLKTYMWIALLDDDPGEKILNVIVPETTTL